MDGVTAAFDALLNEIASEISSAKREGASAFLAGDHDRVSELNDQARGLAQLQTDLKTLRKNWRDLLQECEIPAPSEDEGNEETDDEPIVYQDLYVPILKALQTLGGEARVKTVLDRVEELMRRKFTAHDLERLKAGGIRWRSKASYAQRKLIGMGYTSSQRLVGGWYWRITEEGRKWLGAKTRKD